jgi:hypothetical protein
MTDSPRFLAIGAIGGTLLLLAGCGGPSSGSATTGGGAQGTQTGVGESGGSHPGTSGTNSRPTGEGGINGASTGGTQGTQTEIRAAGGSGTGGTSGVDSRPLSGSGGNSQNGATGGGSGTSGGSGSSQTGGSVGQVGGTTARAGSTSASSGGKTGVSASGGTAGQSSGQSGGASNRGGAGSGGQTGGGSTATPCVGKAWPTADPTVAGPFAIATDKNVGPLAGYTPDPIYGDTQQQFNVYRPKDLATSGYCHPILVWANGHGDNPEQNPPSCVVDSAANKWCGTYPVLINQLASHGFVVIASLSSTTSRGDPLPTIVGLNWLLEQAQDSTSPYYHHLDTTHIGALGHSEGGMSTCKAAADPRITAIGTISGTSTLTSLHGPALFICGGKDTVVSCDSVMNVYNTVTDQPAMFMDNLSADHGGWEYQNGAKGPDIFALTAWFRVHLMGDTANRKYFYGTSCALCTDSRLTVQSNSLMTE